MDPNGIRNTVHDVLAADDSLVITTIHASIGATELLVEVGDRGPKVLDDRVEVSIWTGDRVRKLGDAAGPDEHTAVRNAWFKAKSHI
jgi:hypothetical protein